jgi:solute carrier family 13 (sodium-dependent dicarboxylate transporter), member 2/3/5
MSAAAPPQTPASAAPATAASATHGPIRARWRPALAALLLTLLGFALWHSALPTAAGWTLFIFGAAIVAWAVLDWDETPVALAAALALLACGAITPAQFYAGLGDDFIWLLLGAFVLAVAIRRTALLERWALAFAARSGNAAALFRRLTWFVAATAWLVPSTSGRAAVLLPVFVALAAQLPWPATRRALALLFPTVILLSACVSLLGAGAHLVAVDAMQRLGGPVPGFFGWIVVAAPFGLLSSVLACEMILRLFVPTAERHGKLMLPPATQAPLSAQQRAVLLIVAAALLAWCTSAWHGVPAPLVAVAAALAVGVRAWTGIELKTALRDVEWNLVLFMAATLVLGEAPARHRW